MSILIHHNPDCGTSRNVLALFVADGLTPRIALQTTKFPAEELELLDPSVDDEPLLTAMLDRPALDLLDRLPPGPMTRDDGAPLIDPEGNRNARCPERRSQAFPAD